MPLKIINATQRSPPSGREARLSAVRIASFWRLQQVGRKDREAIDVSVTELVTGEISGVQPRATEVSAGQNGAAQSSILEVSSLQACARQVGSLQIRTLQVGSLQVGRR